MEVIDHDPGYVSSKCVLGSDLATKVVILFGRERAFCGYGSIALESTAKEDTQSCVLTNDIEDWMDMAFANFGCYHDEMECG